MPMTCRSNHPLALAVLFGAPSARVGRLRARTAMALLLLVGLVPGALYLRVRGHVDDQPTERADALIVLGAGGTATRPSPVYRNRLDHARRLYEQGFADTIVVTELAPASEGARRYLITGGVPEEAVLLEDRSTTTWENLRFAGEVARERRVRSVIVVSCGFHLCRATRMARELGFDAQGAAAPGSPIEADPEKRRLQSRLEVRKMFAHALYEPPWPANTWWERQFGME